MLFSGLGKIFDEAAPEGAPDIKGVAQNLHKACREAFPDVLEAPSAGVDINPFAQNLPKGLENGMARSARTTVNAKLSKTCRSAVGRGEKDLRPLDLKLPEV